MLRAAEGVEYSDDHSTAAVNDTTIDLTGGYHLEFDNSTDILQFTSTEQECVVTVNEPENLGSSINDVAYTYSLSENTNNTGILTYQWKRGSTNIGTNSETYMLTADDIGSTITVEISSFVQSGKLISDQTATVQAADMAGITAKSYSGTYDGITEDKFTHEGATSVAIDANSGTVTITFSATSDASVSSIVIKSGASYKTDYRVGDELDVTGRFITANMDDGTTKDNSVTEEMVSGFDSRTVGSKTLTITYADRTTNYIIHVTEDPVYRISLDTSAIIFYTVNVGYEAQDAKTVTVNNIGNMATGKLTSLPAPTRSVAMPLTVGILPPPAAKR